MNQQNIVSDMIKQNEILLLAIAGRCRKGMATVADAEAIEKILQEAHEQIQNQSA